MSTLSRTAAAIALLPLLFFVPAAAGQAGDGFFRTRGTAVVDPSGTPVVLQGVGLGGWLMPEGYMLHVSAPDGGSPRSIRARIVDLIGEADADRFYEIYRANYVEEKDVAAIKAWGFDHVRLPFHYRLLYDPETDAFLEDGFALVDTFLEWCRAHGLYVILDLHAAPGAQNALNISDSDGTARLWTEPVPYQDQTVALWTEIARRYRDETLIVGYDLINEPVLPDGVPGSALRALYVRLAEAVRAVDPNHILFVEGNWYATDFSALEPAFDDNMVYAFHKYWNGTTKNTIQYLLDLRNRTQVPLWLGESGENSNAWFYLVTSLVEGEGIGWNWWTHKKIETVTAPLSAPYAPGYEALVNYWNGAGPRPTPTAARDALFAMAENLDLDSCETRPGVVAALFHHDYRRMREPFGANAVPGVVNAVDYDLGHQGTTYSDVDFMTTSGSPGGGNSGGRYRNDGVDIERSSDPRGYAYNVGWISDGEWTTYTVDVAEAGVYDVEVRVASTGTGGRLVLLLDDQPLGAELAAPNTGGWQNWTSVWLRGVTLPAGRHTLTARARVGGFNLNRMFFTLVSATGVEEVPAGAGPRLLGHYPSPAREQVSLRFVAPSPVRTRLEVFDLTGRTVFAAPWQGFEAGTNTLTAAPGLAAGVYAYRLTLDDGTHTHRLDGLLPVVR